MPEPQHDQRPGLAIVVNSITPYHLHLHRMISAGIPELKLHVLVSHQASDFVWNLAYPPEIEVARFGAEGEHPLENPLRRPSWDWRKGGRFIQYVRNNRVQAVIINGYRFISYLRLINYCHRAGIPAFVNNDSNIRNEPTLPPLKRLAKRSLYKWWIKRVSGVMPMGTLGDQFFIKYGADPRRLYRVPCVPDFSAYDRVDQLALERFRQKFGLSERRHYLLFSGRLIQIKRVDLLIDAFAAIASARPEWDLVIVGDGVLREELGRRVPKALRSRVVWTGFLEGADPVLAYQAADVLVLTSEIEAWSLVIPEAMAAGLVVVSSDIPGATYELVEDGRSGKVFRSGNVEELKSSLLQVTAADSLAEFKRQSTVAFNRWKTATDPVAEIRRAGRCPRNRKNDDRNQST